MGKNRTLGEILVDKKLITQAQLHQALQIQTGGDRRLGYILIKMGLITDDDLLEALSDQCDIPVVSVEKEFSPEVKSVLPRYLCRKYSVMPLSLGPNNVLKVAMVNPLDAEAITDIDNYTGMVVEPVMAKQKEIANARNAYIPFSIKDIINPFIYSRVAQVATIASLGLLIAVAILLYRESYKAKYGTYSAIGDTAIYNNHELMVGVEGKGTISLIGHGPYAKGFYSVVFQDPEGLKTFVDDKKENFSDKQYWWLKWVADQVLQKESK